MLGISRLRNPIQNYAWGSRTGIASFLGRPSPAAEPQAELWLGAHPGASSEIEVAGGWRSLADVVTAEPAAVLGEEVAARHGATLPFLLKVLAAGRGLSIQAHPDRAQAIAGYLREDALGIPREAPERNYRDRNHKPELLYAVTPFTVLRGFRPPAAILEHMERLELIGLMPEVGDALRAGDLERFFGVYMALEAERLRAVLERALARIDDIVAAGGDDREVAWVAKLADQFPGDRGMLAPIFLHLFDLAPGEAAFTGPGVLHAYLEGTGVELMASSDNVVRGGLTPKHVDVGELLRILRFASEAPRRLGSRRAGFERRFETVTEDFGLGVIETAPGEDYRGGAGVEILLCSRGQAQIHGARGAPITFGRGDSLLVPAAAGGYRLQGRATVFRAFVPAPDPR